MQEVITKLIVAIEDFWKITGREIEKPSFSYSKKFKTSYNPDSIILPSTGLPIRGLEGVMVKKNDKSENVVNLLLEKALYPLQDSQLKYTKSNVIQAKKVISSCLEELFFEFDKVENLNERIFESIGFKDIEPNNLGNVIAEIEHLYREYEKITVLIKIISQSLISVGFNNETEISLEHKLEVAKRTEHSLIGLSKREFYQYRVLIFLNAPLYDSNEATSLGSLEIDGVVIKPFMAYADDVLLNKCTSSKNIWQINTVCSFNVSIKVDAQVDEYLLIYELAGKFAEKLVDSLRLVCTYDIGVMGLEVIANESFTPTIRKTFESRYHQDLAPYFPKRFYYELDSLEPISNKELNEVKLLLATDWYGNSVKGLDVSIKRFRSSVERYVPNDPERLLDLAIALEAIYLNDGDNKDLTYRLSLRAARFLGNSFNERHEIFKVLRDLYKYRSKVAHGESLNSLKESDAERLSRVLAQVPLILRKSVIKMLFGHGPSGLKDNNKLSEWWSYLELQ